MSQPQEQRRTPPEHRRYRVSLTLDADSPDEIERVLGQLVTDLYIDRERLLSGSGLVMDVTSGGYESGYSLRVQFDPTMDGERYRRELDEWSKSRWAARA